MLRETIQVAGGIDSHEAYPFQVYRMRLHGQFEYDLFPSILYNDSYDFCLYDSEWSVNFFRIRIEVLWPRAFLMLMVNSMMMETKCVGDK